MPSSCLRNVSFSALFILTVVTTGCGSTAVTPTTPEPPSVTQVFAGTIGPNGSAFYSFTVPQQGTVSFQLASVQRAGVDVADNLTLGLGAPRGTDCAVSTSVTAGASSAALLAASENPGVYCVRVWDAGILPSAVTFSVNITRPQQ